MEFIVNQTTIKTIKVFKCNPDELKWSTPSVHHGLLVEVIA